MICSCRAGAFSVKSWIATLGKKVDELTASPQTNAREMMAGLQQGGYRSAPELTEMINAHSAERDQGDHSSASRSSDAGMLPLRARRLYPVATTKSRS